MKKRVIAFTLAAAMSLTCLAGCDLVTTDNEKDMKQVVAEIDISQSEEFTEDYAAYVDVIGEETVSKRDLVAYFINSGYTYVASYGYTYEATFNLLLNNLVNQKILGQYARVYFFEISKTSEDYNYTVEGYNAAVAAAAEGDKEIAAAKYFLTDEEYAKAVYTLKSQINSSIDSYEEQYISAEDDTEYETDIRTLPSDLETEKEDYYDPDYDIYTGKNAASACGSYETVDGSTVKTRKQAYNRFLKSLSNNYLLAEGEQDLSFEELSYYKTELASQLGQALIEKLEKAIEDDAVAALTEEAVIARYNEILATQKDTFTASDDSFESALDAISDSAFVLYAPSNGFGFVSNILLPFSTAQSYQLSIFQNNAGLTQNTIYQKRAELLKNVLATDQRSSWFNGATDYSFEASEAYGTSNRLFFEDCVTEGTRYELLSAYLGKYAYNGTVSFNEEKNLYDLTPDKLDIDDFIDEMEGYLTYATGLTPRELSSVPSGYYAQSYLGEDGLIDYSRFIYYAGKYDVDFNADTAYESQATSYIAMSAFNELMFAYSTDTGCLNKYFGYTISAYDTSFVKEFEYAAKYAVEQGVGTYVVVPSDYGWHIIYCTFVFEEGNTYTFNWSDIEKEGTFSYLFYEALKDSTAGSLATSIESRVVNDYNNDTCVSKYESRYADFSALDSST